MCSLFRTNANYTAHTNTQITKKKTEATHEIEATIQITDCLTDLTV
jgi:hypothetical protein